MFFGVAGSSNSMRYQVTSESAVDAGVVDVPPLRSMRFSVSSAMVCQPSFGAAESHHRAVQPARSEASCQCRIGAFEFLTLEVNRREHPALPAAGVVHDHGDHVGDRP